MYNAKNIDFDKKSLFLVGLALVLSSFFLYAEYNYDRVHTPTVHTGHAWLIEAVKFYYDGISNCVRSGGKIIEHKFNLEYIPDPDGQFEPASIYDPIFYAAFCAWFWKFTGGPSWWSLKILNSVLFSLIIIWLYRALKLFFKDASKAFIASLGVLFFLPLIYVNILIPRDVYHYYFFVTFLYFLLIFISKKKSLISLIPGSLIVVFCQWVRPALLSSFVMLTVLVLLWGFLKLEIRTKAYTTLAVFWIASVGLFWVPFCIFNKVTYGKYYVVPRGEGLLGSLYETPFLDGDCVEHTTGKFVLRKTGRPLISGLLESDDLCLKLYQEYDTKFPLHKYKCMLLRFKKMLTYDLPWREYNPYKVTAQTSKLFKLKLALTSPRIFLEFFARVYMRLLLFLGYIGILIALLRKEYELVVCMVFGVILSSGYSWLFHIEERVLAVHNWPFGLFAAYALEVFFVFIYARIKIFRRYSLFRVSQ